MPHDHVNDIAKVITEYPYIAYAHRGKSNNNPHFHVLVLAPASPTIVERYRKRIKATLLVTGRRLAARGYTNGLDKGIQYCSREGTEPTLSHPDTLRPYIEAAPAWVPGQQGIPAPTKDGKWLDRDWLLSYNNLVAVAVRFTHERGLQEHSLKKIVKLLITDTKWRPSKMLISGGVPEFYENDYLCRVGQRREPDLDWWTPRI